MQVKGGDDGLEWVGNDGGQVGVVLESHMAILLPCSPGPMLVAELSFYRARISLMLMFNLCLFKS
jgi:hypothetical protein